MNTFFKIKNFDYIIALASYFLIAFFVLNRILFFSPGTIGFFHDWFIGPYPEMNHVYANGGFYIWDSEQGNKIYPTDWIFRLILIPFSFLGGEVLTKGLLVFVLTLSGFGAFCLGKRLRLSPYSSFAVGVIYIFSPIIFTRIVAAHVYYLVAYFLSPFILYFFLKGKEEDKQQEEQKEGAAEKQEGKNKKKKCKFENKKYTYFIIAGILTSLAVIQIQFSVMIFIVLLVFTLVDLNNIKRSALGLVVIFSIAFFINLSPVVLSQTIVKTQESPFNPALLLSYDELIHASNLTKSLRLLGYVTHPYSYTHLAQQGIIPPWVFYLDFLLPIVGFSALIFYRKDKYVLSFALISLIGLFLLKGLNPPLPAIFRFIFVHGFFIFRELWHVSFLYGFGISFLIAFFLERLIAITTTRSFSLSRSDDNTRSAVHTPQYHRTHFYLSITRLTSFLFSSLSPYYYRFKKYHRIILSSFLVSLIVISNGYPLLIGDFGGYMQTFNFPQEYHTIYDNLLMNNTYNTLILPLFANIRYDGLKLEGIDPLLTYSTNLIFPTYLFGNHPFTTSFSIWLQSVMRENRTNHFGNLLGGFGIKYIILRKDFVSHFMNYTTQGEYPYIRDKWFTVLFEPFLDTQKDLTVISNTAHYKIYENTNDAKKFFFPLTFAGGLSDFNDLLYISNFTSLSNVAVYPDIYRKEPITLLDTLQEKKVMPINEDFVELGKYANSTDAYKGWTDNRNWYGYNYLLDSRIPRGAFTSTNGSIFSFELPSKYENKPVEIWLKALMWNRGGNVNIDINGQKSLHSLYSVDQTVSLFKVFEGRSGTHFHLSIKSINGGNYVEGIYIKDNSTAKRDHNNNITKIFMIGIENESDLVSNPNFLYLDNQSRLPLNWNDPFKNCDHNFKCTVNSTTGWQNIKTSFQLSTNITNKNTWSSIYGNGLAVKQGERYELTTHMKLNKFVTGSHIAIQGYNQTSKGWYQITQCPLGTNGPLDWHEYRCEITIPKDTTKIRPVLNAGWSSQPGKQAVTLFDAMDISMPDGKSQFQNLMIENESDLVSNPNFLYLDNQSRLPLNWNDPFKNCDHNFKCTVNSTTGWQNIKTSFQLSTNITNKNTWSWIHYDKQIGVIPDRQYELTTHMKLNKFVTGSHIAIQGYNQTSKGWYQITQCPLGTNGPLDWHEYRCEITIPKDTTKIRPVLNAGWSSQPGKEAVTLFDAMDIKQMNDTSIFQNLRTEHEQPLPQPSPILKDYTKINPTLWNVHISSTSKPFTLSFAEAYDPAWEARIYKDGKEVDVAQPTPLYGAINGFQINQAGNLDIVLRYTRQDWFEIGVFISAITFVLCLFYVFYDWRRYKGDRWTEKVRMKGYWQQKIRN